MSTDETHLARTANRRFGGKETCPTETSCDRIGTGLGSLISREGVPKNIQLRCHSYTLKDLADGSQQVLDEGT